MAQKKKKSHSDLVSEFIRSRSELEAYSRSILMDPHDAEDVVSQVGLEALTAEGEEDTGAWLRARVKYRSITKYNSRFNQEKRTRMVKMDDDFPAPDDVERNAVLGELEELISKFGSIKINYRGTRFHPKTEKLVRRIVGGSLLPEDFRNLGIDYKYGKVLASRIRKRLREFLTERGYGWNTK